MIIVSVAGKVMSGSKKIVICIQWIVLEYLIEELLILVLKNYLKNRVPVIIGVKVIRNGNMKKFNS